MKTKVSLIICILFTYIAFGQIPNRLANSDKRGVINSEIINKQNFIVNFYKIYCENIAKNNETTALTENILSKRLLEKVRNYGVDYGYNIIIDAQDFDEKSIETISALHIKGDLFVVSYFDYYSKKCVIIILKVINNNETYMIEDIVIGSQN